MDTIDIILIFGILLTMIITVFGNHYLIKNITPQRCNTPNTPDFIPPDTPQISLTPVTAPPNVPGPPSVSEPPSVPKPPSVPEPPSVSEPPSIPEVISRFQSRKNTNMIY